MRNVRRFSPFAGIAFAALAVGAVLAGCGGGGSATNPAPRPSTGSATVVFSIQIGGTSQQSRKRYPRYLSNGTASIAIAPVILGVPASPPAVANLSPDASGCSGSPSSFTCTTRVTAPVGQIPFDISTFGKPDGGGTPLSVGSVVIDVKAPTTPDQLSNAVSLTLDPVVSSFVLNVLPTKLNAGKPATVDVSVTAMDATGAIIVGPGRYTTPIELAQPIDLSRNPFFAAPPSLQTEAQCQYAIVPNTGYCFLLAAPGVVEAFGYNGQLPNGVPVAFAAANARSAVQTVAITIATPGPGQQCVGNPIQVCPATIAFANPAATAAPLSVTEPNVTNFTVDATACAQSVGAQVADVNGGSLAYGNIFTIYPLFAAGSCQMKVSDGSGNSTLLNVALLNSNIPSPSPSPTGVATPTPSPLPTGPIRIVPNVLEFSGATAPPQQFVASEPGQSTFTVDGTACVSLATVSPSHGTTFTVTPVADETTGGECLLNVSDAIGNKDPVLVEVDGTQFVIQ